MYRINRFHAWEKWSIIQFTLNIRWGRTPERSWINLLFNFELKISVHYPKLLLIFIIPQNSSKKIADLQLFENLIFFKVILFPLNDNKYLM